MLRNIIEVFFRSYYNEGRKIKTGNLILSLKSNVYIIYKEDIKYLFQVF
jgi:hypothetical protein